MCAKLLRYISCLCLFSCWACTDIEHNCLIGGGKINYSVVIPALDDAPTKADIINDADALKEYILDVDCYTESLAYFKHDKVSYSEGIWNSEIHRPWPDGASLLFLATANLPDDEAMTVSSSISGIKVADFSIHSSPIEQKDILLGSYYGNGKHADGTACHADIEFSHPLAAVVFKFGDVSGLKDSDVIKFIRVEGVYGCGTCIASLAGNDKHLDYDWIPAGEMFDTSLYFDDEIIVPDTQIGQPFLLIPQIFSEHPVNIVVGLTINGEFSLLETSLTEGEWKEGHVYEYTCNYSSGRSGMFLGGSWMRDGGTL